MNFIFYKITIYQSLIHENADVLHFLAILLLHRLSCSSLSYSLFVNTAHWPDRCLYLNRMYRDGNSHGTWRRPERQDIIVRGLEYQHQETDSLRNERISQ